MLVPSTKTDDLVSISCDRRKRPKPAPSTHRPWPAPPSTTDDRPGAAGRRGVPPEAHSGEGSARPTPPSALGIGWVPRLPPDPRRPYAPPLPTDDSRKPPATCRAGRRCCLPAEAAQRKDAAER